MGSKSVLFKSVAMLIVLLAQPAVAGDFDDMVAAEKAFAADAAARSTRDAFIAAFAEDGIVFAPGPVNAKRTWEARPVNANRLEWAPEVAEISASGDLGYTSGPWRLTPARDPADAEATEQKPVAFGHYFSIWRKQADGTWKALVEHGIDHPASPWPETVLRRGGIGLGTRPNWPVGLAELRSADLIPAGLLTTRMVSADFLRLRSGMLPDGKAEGAALPSASGRLDTGLVISAAGDLAATWGGGIGAPAWIRVWRRPSASDAPGHGWVLAADFSIPAAPVQP